MLTVIFRIVLIISCFLLPVWASAAQLTGIGHVAENLLEPVDIVSNFVSTGSIIVGITCLFGAFLRYMQYRVNPLASPISTVFVLLIIGIVLVLLPWTYKLTESGIPYHL